MAPLGYKIVEAERYGQKIKKKLDIDPVEAETVRLIYRLYLECDGTTGLVGVKQTVKWRNNHRYQTRRQAAGVGPVHKILTDASYATGRKSYGKHNAHEGSRHYPSTVIESRSPPSSRWTSSNRVQTKLGQSNPRVTLRGL